MEQKLLLEGLCAHIDERIVNNETLDTTVVLNEFGLPREKEYESFIRDYANITQSYLEKRTELFEEGKTFDLERVFLNSIGGGVLGALVKPLEYTVPAGALVGCVLTAYDELKNLKTDFSSTFWGVFGGALVGSLAGDEKITYLGLAIGGTLGVYKTIVESRENRKKKKNRIHAEIRELDQDYQESKEFIFENTYSALESKQKSEERLLDDQKFYERLTAAAENVLNLQNLKKPR
ncbi:MAG: hypothetical protein KKA62_05810 [Nanoarchaeota archaeon]|nr:hypothetical protein [Nanoarchaeota archaeon]MBU1643848.1 hypothetical protein [Nanoarchaeota archaeon]MBU1977440.1 hypothetical protein [Nanoarchaeota archaeon]